MALYEITYSESVGGRMSERVEADQFGDTGPFIDFLATRDGKDSPVVRQVLRVRSDHVERVELVGAGTDGS